MYVDCQRAGKGRPEGQCGSIRLCFDPIGLKGEG